MAAPRPALERVGDYQVLGKAGAGAMGVVYKAFDPKLNRPVALKFLAEEVETGDRERLLREARAASALDHPNIATVHAAGEAEDGRLFIVMGYYEGESLAQKMRDGALQPEKAINIALQVARGLEHAHAHGVVHRDIKPSNVMLTQEGVAKIVDFGLARHFTPSGSTQSADISGTVPYMSPEQAAGKPVDTRTDIWSLGVLLYQMLSGRLPFQGDSAVSTALAIMNAPPGPIPEVQEALQLVIFRALAKDPAARYASCSELLDDLQKLALDDSEPTAVSTQRHRDLRRAWQAAAPTATGRRSFWVGVALVLIVSVALLLVFFSPGMRALFSSPSQATAGSGAAPGSAAFDSYLKGRGYLERLDKPGNLNAAIAQFETAIKIDGKYALAFAALGEAYWDKYRMDLDPQWLKRAEDHSRRAIELNDQLPAVHVTLGRIHSLSKERELALQEFQQALKLDPKNPDALRGIASLYESMNRGGEAERLYREATTLAPESWVGFSEYGTFYFRRREYDKAAVQYRRAVELTPDNALAHSNFGLARQELGLLDAAESEFKKSLQLQPTYIAYAMLGRLYNRQRRWAEAAAMLEKALQLNRGDYRVWANVATAYAWMHKDAKAKNAYAEELKRLEEAIRLAPEDADMLGELGVLYSRQHLRQKATRFAEAALARAPKNPAVLLDSAEVYENLGDRTRALSLVQSALAHGAPMDEIERNAGLVELRSDLRLQKLAATPPATPR